MVSATNRLESRAMVAVRAKGRNISPVWPETKASGRNTATVVRVDAGDGAGDFGDGGKDVRELLTARGVPSSDGFDDDDRVVDDASDRDRQRTQGQHVQGLPAHPQTDHGDEQRQRDRDRCDDGGADREQEHEDDEDRENSPSPPSTSRSWIDCSMNGA